LNKLSFFAVEHADDILAAQPFPQNYLIDPQSGLAVFLESG